MKDARRSAERHVVVALDGGVCVADDLTFLFGNQHDDIGCSSCVAKKSA